MIVTERILQSVEKLPLPLQFEVFDFVEYLLSKQRQDDAPRDEPDWSSLSLSLAMRGMEDEEVPAYTMADLKVVFQ
jgi:hypothetical protein